MNKTYITILLGIICATLLVYCFYLRTKYQDATSRLDECSKNLVDVNVQLETQIKISENLKETIVLLESKK